MRAGLPVFCVALLVVTTAQAASGALPAVPREGVHPEAKKALKTFSDLVTATKNPKAMGFGSDEEAKTAKLELGEPAMEFVVRLNALKRYKVGEQDPRALLFGGSKVVYPVIARNPGSSNAKPLALLELVKDGTGWRASSFGAPKLGVKLSETRAMKAASLSRAVSDFSIIRVPALSLYFIGHVAVDSSKRHELMLTPIADDPRFGFKAGESQPADRVFIRIQGTALATPDLPG